MKETFGVRNWTKFQHYKHRSPPWFKLYTALLDDPDFAVLADATKAHVVGLLLLAARYDNKIPAMPEWVALKINATTPIDWRAVASWVDGTPDVLDLLVASQGPLLTASTATAVVVASGGMAVVVPAEKPAKARIIPTRATADGVVAAITGLFAAVQDGTVQRITLDQRRSVMAGIVFAYWAKRMAHNGALLDEARERRLMKRLAENSDNIDELLFVVDGAVEDPWTMGTDKQSTRKFNGIETIFRDREKVESMSGIAKYHGQRHPMAQKYEALIAEELGHG